MTMLPNEEHERRMALYRDGLNDREIADQVHVTPEAITFWRKNHGLTANTPRSKITPGMEVEMLRMYQDGMSDGQIAKTIGLVKNTVLSWRRRRGLRANFKRGGEPIHGSQRPAAPARGL